MDVIGRNTGDRHGGTSRLTKEEKEDLVEYLLQIDGNADPALATRPSRIPTAGFSWRALSGGGTLFTSMGADAPPMIVLYDGQGRKTARFGIGMEWRSVPGGWQMEWDGRGLTGRPLPPGIQWARLSKQNGSQSLRRSQGLRLVLGGSP